MSLLIWGATPVATKIAIEDIDPLTTGMLRPILAGPVALICAFAFRLPVPKDVRGRFLLAVSGIASFAIWPVLLSVGIGMTTATHAGLIIALIPLVTGLLTSAVARTWPNWIWWAGSSVAIAGTAVLILSRESSVDSTASVAGDLVVFLGVIACAIGYITGARITPVVGTWATTFWGIVFAAVSLVPVMAFLTGRTAWTGIGMTSGLAMLYLAFFGTIGGYAAWYWALGHGGIRRISSWQLAQPVITLALAALILSETVTVQLALIAGVIIASAAWAQSPQ